MSFKNHLLVSLLFSLQFYSCKKLDIDPNLDTASKIDQYFTYLKDKKSFNGIVLIYKDSNLLFHKAYGNASDEKKLQMDTSTILDIGSITKAFTATAIMKLVEQGLLTTDKKLSDFFTNIPTDKKNITIHQLLTHTSGLPSDFADDLDVLTKEQCFQKVINSALVHNPGEKYEYSNAGYALLGFIVDKVTGQSYHQYIRTAIFQPLGMNSTGFYGDSNLQSLVNFTGYYNDTKTDYSTINSSILYGNTYGNGGILTTSSDLYKFSKAVVNGNFFSQTTKEKIFTDYTDNSGYGWEITTSDYGKVIRHNGGGLGGNSYLTVYPDKNITILILSNRIIYRTAFGVPVKVSLPADETGKQIIENIMSNDFSKLPKYTFPGGRW